jgi:site-specific DNA recombinase
MSKTSTPQVVGYARVSTRHNEQLSALETQKNRLKAAGVSRIYCDVESGRSNGRKAFNELLQLIDKRAIKEIVVTRYDRLGRDATFVDAALVLASKKRVAIRTIDTGIVDTESPAGFLMSRISTSLAEMESKMLSMRIKKALDQRWKDGKIPRTRIPWGYHKVKKGDKDAIELHPIEGEKAKLFLERLREQGYRFGKTVKEFNDIPLKTSSSVRAWLTNPFLRGGIGFGSDHKYSFKKVVWGLHEPLIRHEDWFAIERVLEFNTSLWGANTKMKPKLLSGICFCSECGNRLAYSSRVKETHTLNMRCNTFKCAQHAKRVNHQMIVEAINSALAKRSKQLAAKTETEPLEVGKLRNEIDMLTKLDDPDLKEAIKRKKEKMTALLLNESPILKERAKLMSEPSFWKHALSLDDQYLREVYLEFVVKTVANPSGVTDVELRI